MKKKLLLFCSAFITSLSFGQVIFSVEDPAQLSGSYDITYAPTTTWTNTVDLLDPANAVQDTLAMALDNTTSDSLNCMQTISNVDGKIAVLYRGSCDFGTKALNAEQAGAVAVVIINNVPGEPVGMGAGTDGTTVTIPVVMISDLAGATITSAMENDDIVVFIGNKTGYYPNDVGLTTGNVVRAKQYSIPSTLAQNDTEFDIQAGAWVYNFGFNDASNVKLSATVTMNGTELYNEVASPQDIISGDSAFFQLPVFTETTYPQGLYELEYTVTTDSTDSYDSDNAESANFEITEDIFTYSAIDDNGLPINSGGIRPNSGSDFTSCIAFRNDNASRVGVRGMYFTAMTGAASGASLAGEPFNVQAFQWDDVFTDFDDANADVTDYTLVGFTEYTFEGDYQDSSVYAEFDTPFLLDDNQRYLFCVYNGNSDVFLGYDPSVDYTTTVTDVYNQPVAPILSTGWFLAGFGIEETPALGARTFPAEELGLDKEEDDIHIVAYPSPASTHISVALFGNEVSSINMIDMTGKVVKNVQVQANANEVDLNVQDLENGMYILNVALANGTTKIINVVVNH